MVKNSRQTVAIKARKIYENKLKAVLETKYPGQFVAIEVNSGNYFLGSTPLEAIKKAKMKYPDDSFHVMKVGSRAALLMKKANFRW